MTKPVAEMVSAAIQTVLRDTGRDAERAVNPSMLLAADLGFDSLDLAQTIVLLERSLGVDPFRAVAMSQPIVRTVGDLISIYEQACSKA